MRLSALKERGYVVNRTLTYLTIPADFHCIAGTPVTWEKFWRPMNGMRIYCIGPAGSCLVLQIRFLGLVVAAAAKL